MIIGVTELLGNMEKLSEIKMDGAMKEAISYVRAEAKNGVPVRTSELRESIFTKIDSTDTQCIGTCYTNKEYAPYVEFGTGQKGQENHAGISHDVAVAYRQSPWWLHESQIDKEAAELYHWFYIDTPDGRFYQCTGQPAQPFIYPALKNNEEEILKIINEAIKEQL